MRDFIGKTAFITGGASGIGLGLARAFGQRGMNIMIADTQAAALAPALESLRSAGVRAEGVATDVADRASVEAAAARTLEAFGKVHLVCNNAGVVVADRVGTIPPGDWDWIIDVNLKGVIYGVETFAPLIERHGEGGHIVNTASMAGVMSIPTYEPYTATKFAVVGMSEGWAKQFARKGIGVSVLCPGVVATHISDSRRNRSPRYGEAGVDMNEEGRADVAQGLSTTIVADYVIDCIENDELYIFTHPEFRVFVAERYANVKAAFNATRSSRSMGALPKRPLIIE
jgi:NAD(P)-dependent dehydrogenase (short-subunit alcohol dehydrogenase family)